jgi:hypothetical protein
MIEDMGEEVAGRVSRRKRAEDEPAPATARGERIATERRRRDPATIGARRSKLAVSAPLDHDNYVYRWVNDEGTRLHDMTVLDDWDRVTDRDGTVKTDGAGMGAEVAMPVGMGGAGASVKAVLLRKPRHLHEHDEAAKQRAIDEKERGIKQGATPGADRDGFYTTPGGIVIEGRSRA